MKISKESWHNKVLEFYGMGLEEGEKTNLCSYFLSIVLFTAILPIAYPIYFIANGIKSMWEKAEDYQTYIKLGLIILFSIAGIVSLYVLITNNDGNLPDWLELILVMSSAIGLIFLALISIAIGIIFIEKSKEDQTVSLVKEYLKAKKQKICPIIEFVDENKKND